MSSREQAPVTARDVVRWLRRVLAVVAAIMALLILAIAFTTPMIAMQGPALTAAIFAGVAFVAWPRRGKAGE